MPPNSASRITIQTELSRDLGLTTALSIGIGTMIAAGIFTLSGLAVRNVGSAAVVSFLLAALVATFTALAYCELSSIYPESGEGYLYARRTFPPPVAYIIGCALILGYSSSCAFYLSSFASYFQEFIIESPFELLSGVVALSLLTMINIKGTKESGSFQVVVTTAKVVLLFWFVWGGLGVVSVEGILDQMSNDLLAIGGTSAMVFITFFGFSAIAASAGEIKDPTRTIPRAIFISIIGVTLLYTLVVVVISCAGLTEYTEAAMGVAAVQFLGPVGGMVIIGGALFSMISASNASILAGSRVTLSMSKLGHLPADLGTINPQTRTPIVALLLVGAAILIFSLSLSLENLAHFADTVLIFALILVNAALIVHRRKYPDIDRPFRVPLVPLIPVVGILANLVLLSQIGVQHPLPMTAAFGALVAGVLIYLSWKGLQPPEVVLPGAPTHIALERYASSRGRFRVLVPVANPENVNQLMELAAAVSSDRDSEIINLRAVQVPDQVSPARAEVLLEKEHRILELAHSRLKKEDISCTSLVRVGHNVARAILETARERDCDLIILGWKGYTTTTRKILGDVVDDVVNHAKADIILFKQTTHQPVKDILLPTAGGSHARAAERYAVELNRFYGGKITVCSVVSPEAPTDDVDNVHRRLDKAVARLQRLGAAEVHRKTIRHRSVTAGLVEESENHDSVMIGAAGGSIYPQILFGNIPETVAERCSKPVFLVKHYHPVKELLGRVMED